LELINEFKIFTGYKNLRKPEPDLVAHTAIPVHGRLRQENQGFLEYLLRTYLKKTKNLRKSNYTLAIIN
jgi:hypothetical protein